MKESENYQRLKEGEIHVYLICPESVDITEENWLDSNERKHANQFRFSKDRHLYVIAHLYVRKILSRYGSLPPAAWRFQTNAYGKPFVSNYQYTELFFNLSHTQGLIACIVSYKKDVGIDVEKYKQLYDFNSLCETAFSLLEVADILSLKERFLQEQRFFTYWTLKESYIKACGMGLSIPLQQFSFIKTTIGKWELHSDTDLIGKQKNWQFFSDRINDHYLAMTVAVSPSEMINHLEISFFKVSKLFN